MVNLAGVKKGQDEKTMKNKMLKFTILPVLTLALFAWRVEAVMSDRDFLNLCAHGSLREVEQALSVGANVRARGSDGRTPLMMAAASNPDPNVITALIRGRSEINTRDSNGKTAFMWASAENNVRVIVELRRGRADVNARDLNGKTALMWAAKRNNPGINPGVIRRLLAYRADARIKDNNGNLAIDYARNNVNIVNTDEFWRLNDRSF